MADRLWFRGNTGAKPGLGVSESTGEMKSEETDASSGEKTGSSIGANTCLWFSATTGPFAGEMRSDSLGPQARPKQSANAGATTSPDKSPNPRVGPAASGTACFGPVFGAKDMRERRLGCESGLENARSVNGCQAAMGVVFAEAFLRASIAISF